MRSLPAELSPSLCHQQSSASARTQSRGWPRYLRNGRTGGASKGILLLALTCSLALASLPANQTSARFNAGMWTEDEEGAVVAATSEEAIQGPKIRFIAKAFHTWDFRYRGKVDH